LKPSGQGDAVKSVLLICPSDMRWCDRDDCITTCTRSGESTLRPCHACGILVVRPVNYGYCATCFPAFADASSDKE
jgi:hypothetical protein